MRAPRSRCPSFLLQGRRESVARRCRTCPGRQTAKGRGVYMCCRPVVRFAAAWMMIICARAVSDSLSAARLNGNKTKGIVTITAPVLLPGSSWGVGIDPRKRSSSTGLSPPGTPPCRTEAKASTQSKPFVRSRPRLRLQRSRREAKHFNSRSSGSSNVEHRDGAPAHTPPTPRTSLPEKCTCDADVLLSQPKLKANNL